MKKRSLLSLVLDAPLVLRVPARFVLALSILLPAAPLRAAEAVQADRPNFLIIVADDMNYDSPGFAGGVAPDVTPNLDRFAQESMLFTKAHVAVSVCQPARQSMLSGKYPHRYGGVGFFPMADNTPTVSAELGKAGYLTAALNKLWHTLPTDAFAWDLQGDQMDLGISGHGMGRVPEALARGVSKAIRTAEEQGKPFFIVVNSDDPHRPFHGASREQGTFEEKMKLIPAPSRVYGPDEVTVPRSMPDLPGIREDLARYASSVRRLDDTVGACLEALREAGLADDTVVIFLSDNGIPLLFGKFETYLGSTLTPLLVRWPEHIEAGRVDDRHLISMVDITPTVLELAGAPQIPGVDGRSLVPLMMGDRDVPWRDYVVTLRYEEIYYGIFIRGNLEGDPAFVDKLKAQGWIERPDHEAEGTMSRSMNKRCVNDGQFGYIFNHWFEEGSPKQAYPYGDPGVDAMRAASAEDPKVAQRLEFYTHRSREELYDWESDPGSWTNLIDDPGHRQRLQTLRQNLLDWMDETEDPIREDFRSYLSSLDHGS